jgi:hypothetical protein
MAKETLTNMFCTFIIVLRREKLEYVLNTSVPAQSAIGCTAKKSSGTTSTKKMSLMYKVSWLRNLR